MVWEACPVVVFQDWMTRDQRLDYHIINISPNFVYVVVIFFPPSVNCGDSPESMNSLKIRKFLRIKLKMLIPNSHGVQNEMSLKCFLTPDRSGLRKVLKESEGTI
jgi:hypothetical protein